MSAGRHTLTYFNVRGRGELPRLLFHAGGIPFVDNRIRLATMKKEQAAGAYPFGQVPILDVEGTSARFCQSHAIAQYVASLAGLMPADNVERLRCSMLLLCTEDVRAKLVAIRYSGRTGDDRVAMYREFYTNVLPGLLANFERELNGNGGNFLVGSSLSLADMAVFNMIDYLTFPACEVQAASSEARELQSKMLDPFPGLAKLREGVAAVPGVAKWLASRPQEEHDNVGALAALHSHM